MSCKSHLSIYLKTIWYEIKKKHNLVWIQKKYFDIVERRNHPCAMKENKTLFYRWTRTLFELFVHIYIYNQTKPMGWATAHYVPSVARSLNIMQK